MLFFIIAYFIFDSYGIGDRSVDTKNKSIDAIIAALANKDGSQFVRSLSRVFSMVGSFVGEVDIIIRGGDGRFNFAGWVVDMKQAGEPVLVFLIIPEKVIFMTSTGKTRQDVNKALALPESVNAGFSEIFDYQFDCKLNEKDPYVVVLNKKREFALLKPLIRVGGC